MLVSDFFNKLKFRHDRRLFVCFFPKNNNKKNGIKTRIIAIYLILNENNPCLFPFAAVIAGKFKYWANRGEPPSEIY